MTVPHAARRLLWERLSAFDFDRPDGGADDQPVVLPFAARLARENGWGRGRAARVVEEYRRFLFLAVASGHAVTPSEAVDQAWHLHLVYTRSYWEGLCRGVIGRPLHHGPTRGGPAEATRYHAQYAATLASYRRLFGEPAPPDLWPAPGIRFGADLRWRRVWTARAWIVPKRAALVLAVMVVLLVAVTVMTFNGFAQTVDRSNCVYQQTRLGILGRGAV